MDEGKDCLVETACRMLAIWLWHEEFIGLILTFVILGFLIYWGHHKKGRRNGHKTQAHHKKAA
jgi:hypothetical protein